MRRVVYLFLPGCVWKCCVVITEAIGTCTNNCSLDLYTYKYWRMSTPREPKKRTTRRKKDPNAPKRALSAYMFFANENRDIVRSENPDVTFGQVGRILGERWKALTPDEKTPYEAKAEADKKRYESEKELYNATRAWLCLPRPPFYYFIMRYVI